MFCLVLLTFVSCESTKNEDACVKNQFPKSVNVAEVDDILWPDVETTKGNFWIVASYSHKCPECEKFLKDFDTIASRFAGKTNLKFGRVFCPKSWPNWDDTGSPQIKDEKALNVFNQQTDIYGRKFFDVQMSGSLGSARELLPLVLDIVKPRSVCDVGCGTGSWIKAVQEISGIKESELAGFDFEVPGPDLLIKPFQYHNVDFNKLLKFEKVFDLCISLEVAEHIEESNAEIFVESLVSLSPVILFSAAIPGQGGFHHVNCQWLSYWEALFNRHDYYGVDCLRSKIWYNHHIEVYYRQNAVFFIRKDKLLTLGLERSKGPLLSLVHPDMYAFYHHNRNTKSLPQAMCDPRERQVTPTIRMFHKESNVKYSGERNVEEITNWINISFRDLELQNDKKRRKRLQGK